MNIEREKVTTTDKCMRVYAYRSLDKGGQRRPKCNERECEEAT